MAELVEDLDLTKIDVLRGVTPLDIKRRCYDLCKDYLGGVWLNVTFDEVEVKRISGGFTNQLYNCAITKRLEPVVDEPLEVAIRIYGEKHFNNFGSDGNYRLNDAIIGLLVSENKLGPKIYGLFESGQIQQYYKHKQFEVEEQNDPNLVRELAKMLARVHAMNVPIKKTGNWSFDEFDAFYCTAYKKFAINELIEECNCSTLKKHDLKSEIEWTKECILKTNSPIVFGHNDFRGCNALVIDSCITLCDFEYSCYGFRGNDFGTLFAEWGKSKNDFKKLHNFPDDSIIEQFLNGYIHESVKIYGEQYSSDKINSIQHLLKEVKVFSLFSNIFTTVFLLKSESEPGSPFTKTHLMGFAEIFYQNYFQLKQKFIQEKVI